MQIDRLVNTCKWDEREPMTGAKQIQKKCNCALQKTWNWNGYENKKFETREITKTKNLTLRTTNYVELVCDWVKSWICWGRGVRTWTQSQTITPQDHSKAAKQS